MPERRFIREQITRLRPTRGYSRSESAILEGADYGATYVLSREPKSWLLLTQGPEAARKAVIEDFQGALGMRKPAENILVGDRLQVVRWGSLPPGLLKPEKQNIRN